MRGKVAYFAPFPVTIHKHFSPSVSPPITSFAAQGTRFAAQQQTNTPIRYVPYFPLRLGTATGTRADASRS